MKTNQKLPMADGRWPIKRRGPDASSVSIGNRKSSTLRSIATEDGQIINELAFTLIELLIIIAVIGILAALIFPVVGAVKRQAFIRAAQGELAQIQTAIERYKSAYGFYPPSNTNNALVNPLYFELTGTTNINGTYQTLDGAASIAAVQVSPGFDGSISGFINCSKPGADESAVHPQNFLPGLKPRQIAQNYTNNNVALALLVCAVGGPDPTYRPLSVQNLNPWRYNSSNPTNNPGTYDLWVQLVIAGKTNLICNWDKQVKINSPDP